MTHIVAGYPTLKGSEKIALTMIKSGVDFIEIQIPFSDPVADGPTIMKANEVALKNGTTVESCFHLMEKLSGTLKKSLKKKEKEISAKPKFLFMSYFNILYHYGLEKFCKRAKECGCYGLIVPDMPIDEEKNENYLKICKKYRLKPIQVISPLTPTVRLKKIAKHARGFVYCVSRYGSTGQSNELNPKLKTYLQKVKQYIKLPLAVGFGISQKTHIEAIHKYAEIAVIGSKIINIYNSEGIKKVENFLSSILIAKSFH